MEHAGKMLKLRSFANTTFGTTRVTAYKLLEDTLNLKDIKIYDTFDERRGTE